MQALAQTQIQKSLASKRESVYDEEDSRIQSQFKQLLRKNGHFRGGSEHLKSPLRSIPWDGPIRPNELVSNAAYDEYFPKDDPDAQFKFYSPNCSSQKPARNKEFRHCQSTKKEKPTGQINASSDLKFEFFGGDGGESRNNGKPTKANFVGYNESPFVFENVETVDDIVDSELDLPNEKRGALSRLKEKLPNRQFREDSDLGLQKHLRKNRKLFKKSSSLREKMRAKVGESKLPENNANDAQIAQVYKFEKKSEASLRKFRRSKHARFLIKKLVQSSFDRSRFFLDRLRKFNQEYKFSVLGFILDHLLAQKRKKTGNKFLRLLQKFSRESVNRKCTQQKNEHKNLKLSKTVYSKLLKKARNSENCGRFLESKVSRIDVFRREKKRKRESRKVKKTFGKKSFLKMKSKRRVEVKIGFGENEQVKIG